MITLKHKDRSVRIDMGELIGFRVGEFEYMHQKGSPGWRSTDTEMFPIIGPTADANFKVQSPKGIAVQDQHGLLREMPYELTEQSGSHAIFRKTYTAGTKIRNSKYPEKATAADLFWPYDFEFIKYFQLSEQELTITFKISGDEGMPFMLGYHPAFRLTAESPTLLANGKIISLKEVLAVGSRALQVPNCSEIVLADTKKLRIKTEGFGSFMLWTEVPNMVCIEPITFYPYAVEQHKLHHGFQTLKKSTAEFKVSIAPQ